MLTEFLKSKIAFQFGKSVRYPKDCEALAAAISKFCNENISASTLMRIYNIRKSSLQPRQFTLDILSQYIGYSCWKEASSTYDCSNFKEGDIIQICFATGNALFLSYKENNFFRVVNADQTKLQNNDLIHIAQLELNYPLIAEKVLRKGVDLGAFIGAKEDKISTIEILNDEISRIQNSIYSKLINEEDVLVFKINREFNITWTNKSWQKIFACESQPITPISILDIMTEETKIGFSEREKALISGKSINDFIGTFITKNKKEINLLGSLFPVFEDGVYIGSQGVMKKVGNKYIPHFQVGNNIENTPPDPKTKCLIIDKNWNYLYINSNNKISGIEIEDNQSLIGKNILSVYPELEKTRVFTLYKLAMNERTRIHFFEKFKFKDGTKKWYEITIEPIDEGIVILYKDRFEPFESKIEI